MNRAQPQTTAGPLCERSINGVNCTKGPGGGPAEAVEQVDGYWYWVRLCWRDGYPWVGMRLLA